MAINYDQLSQEEKDSTPSQIHSAISGLASGVIFEAPKGIFSLAANVLDLGLGTDLALKVEQIADGINPFKEDAESTAIGRMAQLFGNLGMPSTIGFKLASRLAKGAVEAKKAGTYLNLGNKGLMEASKVASEGNKALEVLKYGPRVNELSDAERIKSFVAGSIGAGASDAAFIGDVKNAGTLGDIFGGPTQLDRSEDYDPARELINKVKFGTESALFSGLIAGTGSTISKLRDRNWMADPGSNLDKFFGKIVYGLRPGEADPAEVFKFRLNKLNNIKADTELAKMNIDAMFPEIKSILNNQTNAQKRETLNIFNDLLISGEHEVSGSGALNLGKINDDVKKEVIDKIKQMGGNEQNINNVLNG